MSIAEKYRNIFEDEMLTVSEFRKKIARIGTEHTDERDGQIFTLEDGSQINFKDGTFFYYNETFWHVQNKDYKNMKKAIIILNEQHTLLPEQEEILTARFGKFETLSVPANGWTKFEQEQAICLIALFPTSVGMIR